jgi:hypothetical protein
MAKALGSVGIGHVSLDGITWTLLGKCKKFASPIKNDPVDATDNDDNGAKSSLYGDQSYDVTGTCNYDPSDPGQLILSNGAANKTIVYFRNRPRGTGTGLPQISGQAVLESADIFTWEHEKVEEFAVKATSTGPWSVTTQ